MVDTANVRRRCRDWGCYVIHNNWVAGRKKKLKRQMDAGLWEYDSALRMCRHPWQRDARHLDAF